MNRWEDTVLTDKGAALQAKLADGQTLKITKVMTGASKVPVVNLRQQTRVTDGGKRIILKIRMKEKFFTVSHRHRKEKIYHLRQRVRGFL